MTNIIPVNTFFHPELWMSFPEIHFLYLLHVRVSFLLQMNQFMTDINFPWRWLALPPRGEIIKILDISFCCSTMTVPTVQSHRYYAVINFWNRQIQEFLEGGPKYWWISAICRHVGSLYRIDSKLPCYFLLICQITSQQNKLKIVSVMIQSICNFFLPTPMMKTFNLL